VRLHNLRGEVRPAPQQTDGGRGEELLSLARRGDLRRRPRVVVALGRVAWDAVIRTLGAPPTPFAHGAVLQAGAVKIYASYHPRPLNVGTRRASLQQIAEVIKKAAAEAGCLP
jgi:uracil-DNA glycosylase